MTGHGVTFTPGETYVPLSAQHQGQMMATCRGIDVSAYQGTQNWAALKADGIAFAFAKASEGQKGRDARFATHIKGIKAAGLVPGAYHFAWPNQDPKLEAANYIAAVKPHAGQGFTHWLDLERYSDGRNYRGKTAAQIKSWVQTWISTVQSAFPGQRVGVYTSADDLKNGHVPAGTPLWYPAYPWGAAAYAKAEAASKPKPSGWSPLIWQFTSQPVDRSICYLSAAALRDWADGTTSPATKEEEDDVPSYLSLGLTKDLTVKPGDWVPLAWDAEYGDPLAEHPAGGQTFVAGPGRYSGTAYVRVKGLTKGAEVQVRVVEDDATGKTVKAHPIGEGVGTAGDTFYAFPLTGYVGQGRKVKLQFAHFGDQPVTFGDSFLKILVWNS